MAQSGLALVRVQRELTDEQVEIPCLYGLLDCVEEKRKVIDRAWRYPIGGNLVGLKNLRTLLQDERVLGAFPSIDRQRSAGRSGPVLRNGG